MDQITSASCRDASARPVIEPPSPWPSPSRCDGASARRVGWERVAWPPTSVGADLAAVAYLRRVTSAATRTVNFGLPALNTFALQAIHDGGGTFRTRQGCC